MTEHQDRFGDDLLELSREEMQHMHGGTDEPGDFSTMSPEDSETIASHGYIRVKKLNSGG